MKLLQIKYLEIQLINELNGILEANKGISEKDLIIKMQEKGWLSYEVERVLRDRLTTV